MKSIYLQTIIFSLFALVAVSCETEIEFRGDDAASLLVVNSIVSPDSAVKVHVSESKFFLKDDSNFENVNDATINLWVNGSLYEQLVNTGQGFYAGNYIPKAGDLIKITAKNNKFPEVNAESEIVQATPIVSVDTTILVSDIYPIVNDYGNYSDTIGYSKTTEMKINLKFNDPPNQKNYYKIAVKLNREYNDGSKYMRNYYFSSNDLVFGNTTEAGIFDENSYNSYHEFNDDIFDGKNYSLKLNTSFVSIVYDNDTSGDSNSEPIEIVKNELILELQSISKSYYLYLKTRNAGTSVIDFFSEPVQIYSNIEGGIGILGSYNTSRFKIDIPKTFTEGYYD